MRLPNEQGESTAKNDLLRGSPYLEEKDLLVELDSLQLATADGRRALSIARRVHQDDTRVDGAPYLQEHIYPVTAAAAHYAAGMLPGRGEIVVIIAILHDALEHSLERPEGASRRVSLDELRTLFGDDVASQVETLTKSPSNSGDAYFEGIRSGPRTLQLIKVFDRLNNLACLHKAPASRRSRYLKETRALHLPLARGLDPHLAAAMENAVLFLEEAG
jgi:(p)ppGpp synthase/HD superfamily hydrolase